MSIRDILDEHDIFGALRWQALQDAEDYGPEAALARVACEILRSGHRYTSRDTRGSATQNYRELARLQKRARKLLEEIAAPGEERRKLGRDKGNKGKTR